MQLIKIFFVVYGIICYLVSLVTLLWAVAFVGGLVPPELRANAMALPQTLLIDLGLISLFGVQHSVMARAGFKRWWTRIVPQPIERSTYVLLASLALLLLFWQWRPLPGVVWHVEQPLVGWLLWGLCGLGWLLVGASTFAIDHFDLMGLRQPYTHLHGARLAPPAFKASALYSVVRHPLMLGFLIAFWATPHMTLGHLLFALSMTAYILIGVRYEERDLVRIFGSTYQAYRQRVPMLLPVPGRVGREDVSREIGSTEEHSTKRPRHTRG
jgi:protein-S-isoprenylcysteine O-methyltransferase Ste14